MSPNSQRSKEANAAGAAWEAEILRVATAHNISIKHIPTPTKIIGEAPANKRGYTDHRLKLCRLETPTSVDFEGFLPVDRVGGLPLLIEAKASVLPGDTRVWPLPDRLRLRQPEDGPSGIQGLVLSRATMQGLLAFVLLRITFETVSPSTFTKIVAHKTFMVPGLASLLYRPSWNRDVLLPYEVRAGQTWVDVLDNVYLHRMGMKRTDPSLTPIIPTLYDPHNEEKP